MMRAATIGALKKGEPVLFYLWTPHEFFAEYPFPDKVRWLKGTEKHYPVNRQSIIANVNWVAQNPEAAKFLSRFKLPIEEFNQGVLAMSKVEKPDDPQFLTRLARQWLEEHHDRVDSWLEGVIPGH